MIRTGEWAVVTKDCYNFFNIVSIPKGLIVYIVRKVYEEDAKGIYSCRSIYPGYLHGNCACLYMHESNLRNL